MNSEVFSLGAVLSITTGILLTDIGKVYEILNFMTNDNLYTHQLPRASRECKPWILRQHPELKGIDVSDVNRNNWQEKLAELQILYPERLVIEQIPMDDHDFKNPVEELEEMVGTDKIIVVDFKE